MRATSSAVAVPAVIVNWTTAPEVVGAESSTGSWPGRPSTTTPSATITVGSGTGSTSSSRICTRPSRLPICAPLTFVMRMRSSSVCSTTESPITGTLMSARFVPLRMTTRPRWAVKSSPAAAVPPIAFQRTTTLRRTLRFSTALTTAMPSEPVSSVTLASRSDTFGAFAASAGAATRPPARSPALDSSAVARRMRRADIDDPPW